MPRGATLRPWPGCSLPGSLQMPSWHSRGERGSVRWAQALACLRRRLAEAPTVALGKVAEVEKTIARGDVRHLRRTFCELALQRRAGGIKPQIPKECHGAFTRALRKGLLQRAGAHAHVRAHVGQGDGLL